MLAKPGASFRREATKGLPGGSLLQAGDCAIISGFTVTMRLTVQPSGSAFMHESSGTVAPIIDVSGRSDNFR